MKSHRGTFAVFVINFLFAFFARAEGYNISGKILKPDGTPFSASSVSFILEVMSPDGACILFKEQIDGVNMSNTKGAFHVVLGNGTTIFPTGGSVESVFINNVSLNCFGSNVYMPQNSDERLLRISFYDGSGWQTFSKQPLKSVPLSTFSKYSQSTRSVEHYGPSNLLRSNSDVPELSGTQITNLVGLINGTSGFYVQTESDPTVKSFAKSDLPNCPVGEVLRSDGTKFVCVSTGNALPGVQPGKFLKSGATDWIPSDITMADISGLNPLLNQKVSKSDLPSCLPHQTIGFVSASDTWQCLNINLTLTGDVTGAHGNNTVAAIRGTPVAMTAPANGQVLKFNGTSWAPAPDAVGAGTVTQVTSSDSYITIANNTIAPVVTANIGNSAGTLAKGDDPRFSDSRIPTGSASGDLGGNYPSPTINKIQGATIDITGIQSGDILVYSATPSPKWTVKRLGCDAGWTMVPRGVPFCLRYVSATPTNYYNSANQCADIGAELCTVNQSQNACRNSSVGAGVVMMVSQFDGFPVTTQCTSGTALTSKSADSNYGVPIYCCKPVGYY